MKSKSPKNEKHLSKDQESFEKLPPKTQDKLLLGEEAEKAIGKDRVNINHQIKRQPRPENP